MIAIRMTTHGSFLPLNTTPSAPSCNIFSAKSFAIYQKYPKEQFFQFFKYYRKIYFHFVATLAKAFDQVRNIKPNYINLNIFLLDFNLNNK